MMSRIAHTIPVSLSLSLSLSLSMSGDGFSPVLILDYFQLGNLSFFLRDNFLHSVEIIQVCLCIISGLEYLYRDIITSTSSKPGDIEIHYLHVGTQSVIATGRFHGLYHGPHAFKRATCTISRQKLHGGGA